MKTCFKCGIEQPIENFYPHPQMADGHLGKCKSCTLNDVKVHRLAHLDRIRAYDRERAKLPHKKAMTMRGVREWRHKYPDRVAAHNAAQRAYLTAPDNCKRCNEPRRLEKHHPDYSKPLMVEWLCKPCHVIADRIRRQIEAF